MQGCVFFRFSARWTSQANNEMRKPSSHARRALTLTRTPLHADILSGGISYDNKFNVSTKVAGQVRRTTRPAGRPRLARSSPVPSVVNKEAPRNSSLARERRASRFSRKTQQH